MRRHWEPVAQWLGWHNELQPQPQSKTPCHVTRNEAFEELSLSFWHLVVDERELNSNPGLDVSYLTENSGSFGTNSVTPFLTSSPVQGPPEDALEMTMSLRMEDSSVISWHLSKDQWLGA